MKKFTSKEDQFIRDNYLLIPAKRMAKILGRSESGVWQRMRRIQTIPDDSIIKKFKEQSRFKKGAVAHNKGKKQSEYMTPQAIKRTAITRFVNGHKPHNTIEEDGAIRVRTDRRTGVKCLYIKLNDAQWMALHRYNYLKAFGTLPKGMCISFKDGNQMNCDIENLQLITRKENILRNTIHRYPLPVKRSIFALKKLQKQIKQTT